MKFDYELVGKIGSMALIRKADNDIDYTFSPALARKLKPGMIWCQQRRGRNRASGHLRRNGKELTGDAEEVKADYASRGRPSS